MATTATIARVGAGEAEELLPGLVALLQDAVESGASLGFWQPLGAEEAERYWRGVFAEVEAGARTLLVARREDEQAAAGMADDGAVVGSVQLAPALGKPNGARRAEVQKLMTLRAARRQGIGRALMHAIEREALAQGRTLLVLDTNTGSDAETLYRTHGYTEVGRIPGYTVERDGSPRSTTIFYRHLDAGEG